MGMTPREPDRFDKQARETYRRMFAVPMPVEERQGVLAAALRAAESSALERAAQEALDHGDGLSGEELAEAIRALIPPAAAPAAHARCVQCGSEALFSTKAPARVIGDGPVCGKWPLCRPTTEPVASTELRALLMKRAEEAEAAVTREWMQGDSQMQSFHTGRKVAFDSIIDLLPEGR
jgi:hypothetical protein